MACIEYHPENGECPWVVIMGKADGLFAEGLWFACRSLQAAGQKVISLRNRYVPLVTTVKHLGENHERN